jgi:N6-adenosine-specific RNA methylase IME4
MPSHNEGIAETVVAPKAEYSRKPDAAHQRVDLMYPTASKTELFARRPYPGWAVWGYEV